MLHILQTWDTAMETALSKRCPDVEWSDITLVEAQQLAKDAINDGDLTNDDLYLAVEEAHPYDAAEYLNRVREKFAQMPIVSRHFRDAIDNHRLDEISRRGAEAAMRRADLMQSPPHEVEPSMDDVQDELKRISDRGKAAAIKRFKSHSQQGEGTMGVMSAIGERAGGDSVRVKAPSESLCHKKYDLKNPDGSPRLNHKGRPMQSMSEFDWARMGVYMKFAFRGIGVLPDLQVTEWDRSMYQEMVRKDVWIKPVGLSGEEYVSGEANVKTVLQELLGNTSDAIVPEWYDTSVIELMLLEGEIFPYCGIRDVPMGSVIEAAQIGNVTGTWDQVDGTDMTLFDPTNLLTPITANVKNFTVLVEVGNELLNDTPVQFGRLLAGRMINKASAELDRVVVSGAAADEPEGVMNASGTTDIASQNGAGGPLTDADHINLSFGIPKVLDRNARYAMKRATYKRFRSIVTGVTGDDRRLYQGGLKSYMIDDVPVSVVEPAPSSGRGQGGLTDRELIYGNFRDGYRVWRRQGMTLSSDSTGYTNVRRNQTLFSLRMRLAGKVVDAEAFAIMDDADAGT